MNRRTTEQKIVPLTEMIGMKQNCQFSCTSLTTKAKISTAKKKSKTDGTTH